MMRCAVATVLFTERVAVTVRWFLVYNNVAVNFKMRLALRLGLSRKSMSGIEWSSKSEAFVVQHRQVFLLPSVKTVYVASPRWAVNIHSCIIVSRSWGFRLFMVGTFSGGVVTPILGVDVQEGDVCHIPLPILMLNRIAKN